MPTGDTIESVLREADGFLDSGQSMHFLHEIDDPSKMKTREEVVGRQAVVALKLRMALEDGRRTQSGIDAIRYNAIVYMGLARRDSELAKEGLPFDPTKAKMIGVQ